MTLQEAYNTESRSLITIKRRGGKETYSLQFFDDEHVELVGDRYGRWIQVKRSTFDKDWTIE